MYERILKKGFIISILVLFVGATLLPSTISVPNQAISVPVTETTWIVDDDGNDCDPLIPDFDDIQPAVNAASDGDTIHVYAGNYNKTVIDKKLTLIGGFNGTSLIDNAIEEGSTVSITADYVTLDGFTIIHSGDFTENIPPFNRDAGVHILGKDAVVIDNIITDNGGNGIYSKASITIENNIIHDNSYDGIGIYTEVKTSSPQIRFNCIQDNGLDGIYCWKVFQPIIHQNYISGNGHVRSGMSGIKLHRSRSAGGFAGDIQGNWIVNNFGDGIIITRFAYFNKVWQNNISGNSGFGIFFEDKSNLNNVFENDFIGNNYNQEDCKKNASTQGCFIQIWEGNYWDDRTGKIYRIPGTWLGILPTFLDWDFQPADIPWEWPNPVPECE